MIGAAATVTMMEARNGLGELCDRAALRDEVIVLARRGHARAVLVSATRLERLERAAARLEEMLEKMPPLPFGKR